MQQLIGEVLYIWHPILRSRMPQMEEHRKLYYLNNAETLPNSEALQHE